MDANFKKIADRQFSHIFSNGLDFTLFVTGDIEFKYYFHSAKSPSQIESELMHLFASQTEKMGDQVMICVCRILDDFVLMNFDSTDDLVLTVDIDL